MMGYWQVSIPLRMRSCAAAIQNTCEAVDGLKLRIGIHLGEVVFENNDVFGDGVNIASRLQTLAPIGGTWISEAVYKNIVNKKEFISTFAGEETLKNVSEPVKIYEVKPADDSFLQADYIHQIKKGVDGRHLVKRRITLAIVFLLAAGLLSYFLFLKQKPDNHSAVDPVIEKSIAIIPFRNMSNDPQQEYFVEGMMDEILNHLYKIGGLNVISRTSSMTYKDSKKTSKQIAAELGVANLLEGSVQKDGDHIRIIVQLINGRNDQHLWAETYDRQFKDVFVVQSEIAQQVAFAMKVKIDPEVKERIEKKPTENTAAYILYLQARDSTASPEKNITLLNAAIASDSTFADAYAELALNWMYRGSHLGDLNSREVLKKAEPLLQRSLKLNPDLAQAHAYLAYLHLWYKWDFETVQDEYQKVLQLNPSNPEIIAGFGDYLLAMGRFGEALNISTNVFEKDNSSISNRIGLSLDYYYNGKSKDALQLIRPVASQYEKNDWLLINYIKINLYTNQFETVLLAFEKYKTNFPSNLYPIVLSYAAIAYCKTGQKDLTERYLNEIKAISANPRLVVLPIL